MTRRREREPADASVTSSPRNAAIQPFPPVPGDGPVALLVRHAERPPLPVGESGDHVSLTPAGIAQARALGATLGTRLRCVWTSPIRRCRETSEHLRAGCNQQVDIRDDTLLGDPGVFVIDAALAWTNWQRLGNEGVIEHLMSGDGALPGMREPIAAAMLLLERVAGALSGPAGVHVFITHDAVLAPWIARMFGDRLDRASWPRFLDGAAVWRSRRGLHVRYRDREEIRP